MTEKRFKHKHNMLGMQFICYDDKDILLGTFADNDGVEHIVDKLNAFQEEKEQLLKENKRLYEDNIRVKQLITDFYNNERTAIGRSVIQQILEAL